MSIRPVDMQVVLQNVGKVENPNSSQRLDSQQQHFNQAFQAQVEKQQQSVIKANSSDTDSGVQKDKRNKEGRKQDKRKNKKNNSNAESEEIKSEKTSLFDISI